MEVSIFRLGDCVTCNPSVKLEKGKECPVIDIDKITVGRKFVENRDTVIYNGQGGAKFENGDTLLARITPCLENGKMAQARIDGKGIGSTELFVFRGKEGVSDNEFVYYLLKQQYIRDLAANSMSGASGRQRADLKFIKKIKLDIPPLPTQRRIASILSAYDNLIENNNKRIRLLEQMAENLYKEWFVRFRFPGHEKVEMENGLPKGWKYEPIRKNNKCYLGGTPSREKNEYWEKGDIPWINSGEINKIRVYKESEFITRLALEKSATKLLPIRSTLVAITGATVGQVSLNEIEVCANQSVVGIVSSLGYHCFTYFSLVRSINTMVNYASGGAQQHINKDIIEKFKILTPEDKIIRSFEKIVTPYFDSIFVLLKANDYLTRQRDLLLPRLMSGKLEVKE